MRTTMSHWFKLAFAVMLSVSLGATASADDKDKNKDKQDKTKMSRAEKRRLNTISKGVRPAAGFKSVKLFEAMDRGDIEVIIRTKDAANSNLIVINKSKKPLAIEMPLAFSAVPAFRQVGAPNAGGGGGGIGNGGGGFGNGGGGFGGGGNQGVGGGFGGGGNGGGFGGGGNQGGGGFGNGGGGGVFNIPPQRTGKVAVKTFCLEEGKPDPKSRIKYTIQPLDKLNSDPKIFEMCRMLANNEIAQPVAQAAAWNVANGLSWRQLLVKNRVELMDGSYERYFHPNHLRIAQQVTVVSAQRAEARKKAGKQLPSSDQERYNAKYNAGK